jgi:hypothetical protein
MKFALAASFAANFALMVVVEIRVILLRKAQKEAALIIAALKRQDCFLRIRIYLCNL